MNYKNNYHMSSEWTSSVIKGENSNHPDLKIAVITEACKLPELEYDWNDIVLDSTATIYQTFEWSYYWWKHFATDPNYSLHILLIYLSGKMIGLAPFFIQSHTLSGFRVYRSLRIIGSGLNSGKSDSNSVDIEGPGDYLDVISRRGYESIAADAIALYLDDARYFFDGIFFQNVSEQSFLFTSLFPLLKKSGFTIQTARTDICPRINLPGTIDEYLYMVRSSTRRRLRQAYKKNTNDEDCTIEEINYSNLSPALQNLKHLHQKRWNELGYPGLFSDRRFEKFQADVCEAFFRKGWLWFKVVRFKNKIIASRVGFVFKDRVYDYLSGFDSSSTASSKRPGILLLLLIIKDAISQKLGIVDLLRGSEEYKFELTSGYSWNYDAVAFNTKQNSILRLKLFYLLKLFVSFAGRLRREKLIIKLFAKDQDKKIKPIYNYLKFCLGRLNSNLKRNNSEISLNNKISKMPKEKRIKNPEEKKPKYEDKKRIPEAEVNV